ncbi:MAG TPA: ribulose-phosphate 3-epimerase [Vicinamibacterales bacterium]|nr:ribulose-phosphate 3-epimerase [Vicinamibacterales bacterium]
MSVRIAPSILAADFAALGEAVRAVERGGADLIHVDVMDGRFVPNITVGIPIVEALARIASVPLDVHLMISDPERYIEDFARAGARMLSVHAEATRHLHRAVERIKRLGLEAGVALNPATPATWLEDIAAEVDFVVVMSVDPGFTGQRFIPRSLAKVEAIRALLARSGSRAVVELDGGIDLSNAARAAAAGAGILVAGHAIFAGGDAEAATRALRAAAGLVPSLGDRG